MSSVLETTGDIYSLNLYSYLSLDKVNVVFSVTTENDAYHIIGVSLKLVRRTNKWFPNWVTLSLLFC